MSAFTFYYDVVCPYAYLASTQVEALAARHHARIDWQPVLLGGIFRAIGQADVPAQHMPAVKQRHGHLDLLRYADVYGVTLGFHPEHPRRSVEAMRLTHTVEGETRVKLTHALYRAYFVARRDIADRAVLSDVLDELDLPRTLLERIDEAAVKEALRAATERAVADGAFGVPAFVVEQGGRRFLFWGQDRLTFVDRALGGWPVPA